MLETPAQYYVLGGNEAHTSDEAGKGLDLIGGFSERSCPLQRQPRQGYLMYHLVPCQSLPTWSFHSLACYVQSEGRAAACLRFCTCCGHSLEVWSLARRPFLMLALFNIDLRCADSLKDSVRIQGVIVLVFSIWQVRDRKKSTISSVLCYQGHHAASNV